MEGIQIAAEVVEVQILVVAVCDFLIVVAVKIEKNLVSLEHSYCIVGIVLKAEGCSAVLALRNLPDCLAKDAVFPLEIYRLFRLRIAVASFELNLCGLVLGVLLRNGHFDFKAKVVQAVVAVLGLCLDINGILDQVLVAGICTVQLCALQHIL